MGFTPQDRENIIVDVKHVNKYFYSGTGFFGFFKKRQIALNDISFDIRKGEILGITGNNSSGKSTIAKILTGSVERSSGTIKFGGRNLKYGDMRFRRSHIRMADIEQIKSISLPLDVYEFLQMTLNIAGIFEEFHDEIIGKTLLQVNASSNLVNKLLTRLNTQEQSIVALAFALILQPEIIVVEDMFSLVDSSFQGFLINILLSLQEQGTTIIIITTDLGIVKHICDRVVILRDGVVEDVGTTYDVFNNPKSEFTRRLVHSYFGKSLGPAD